MWWAIATAGLLAAVVVPVWGWRSLARALDDPSAGPWLPIARLGYAADAAGGRLRRLTLAAGALFTACALALVGTFLWRASVDRSLAATDLPSDLAAVGVPTWITVAVVVVTVVSGCTMRVGLISQAVVARRDLKMRGTTVAAMVGAAWIWARVAAPAVRTQRDEAERARIAALGPEPAPQSRFALPLEASADEQAMLGGASLPSAPDATRAPGAHTRQAPAVNAAPAVPLSALPPGQRAPVGSASESPSTDITGTVPSPTGGVPREAGRVSADPHTGTTPDAAGSGWALVTKDGTRLPLHQAQLTVGRGGRGATADVAVTDPTRTMSKSHAELLWDGTQWQVRDLGSTNGTHLARGDGTFAPLPRDEHVPVTAAMRFGDLEATILPRADRSNA